VAGKPVRNVAELMTAVAALPPNQAAAFTVQRADGSASLEISPGVRPTPQQLRGNR
jgi:S1-C subfamily serine protease